MGAVDEVAWKLRRQMSVIWERCDTLEETLYALWRDPASDSARDEAARLLAVGPYEVFEGADDQDNP